jgi:hypothetical protein
VSLRGAFLRADADVLRHEDWTVRQMIEHTLYWERHSIVDLSASRLHDRLTNDGVQRALDVTDPIYGKLSATIQPD